MTIPVRIRLFALQRELAGARELTLELDEPATIADAWAALVGLHPVLAPGASSVRFARNGAYASAGELLAAGDEVAMIPPVSGGSTAGSGAGGGFAASSGEGSAAAAGSGAGGATGGRILELRTEPFPAELIADLARRLAEPADGAIVTFLGITRASPGTPAPGQEAEAARHARRRVEALEYEALESLALRVFGEIADEIRERFGVERLAIVHRIGGVPLGEPSVAIVACAAHRSSAFEAAAYAIDETKARAPIWKAERFIDGHVWIGAPAREGPRPAG